MFVCFLSKLNKLGTGLTSLCKEYQIMSSSRPTLDKSPNKSQTGHLEFRKRLSTNESNSKKNRRSCHQHAYHILQDVSASVLQWCMDEQRLDKAKRQLELLALLLRIDALLFILLIFLTTLFSSSSGARLLFTMEVVLLFFINGNRCSSCETLIRLS